jgi:O-acetylserine/cysteine efflux transporter
VTAQHTRFGPLDALAAFTCNFMMGMNVVAMKIVITSLGPFTTAAVRFGVVCLLCAPWCLRERQRIRTLILFGIINGAVMLGFLNLALKFATNVGALAIVGQLAAPFSVVLGVLILHEHVTATRAAGTALAFAGVAMMVFDPRIADDLLGLGLMALSAFAWAVSSLLQRRLAGVPVTTLYFWTGLMAFLVLMPLGLIWEPGVAARLDGMSWQIAGWLAFSILGVTLMGQGSTAWLLSRHPVSLVMPLTLATPVVAVIAAYAFFRTPVTASMIVGGLAVLSGIALVMMKRPAIAVETPSPTR